MAPVTRFSAKRSRSDRSESDEDVNFRRSKRCRIISSSTDSQTEETTSDSDQSSHSHYGRRDKNLKKNTCSICKRVFKRLAHLRDHLAVHDPNRQKYRCSYENCDKEYNEIKNWRAHFLKHHSFGPMGHMQLKLKKYEKKLKKVIYNNFPHSRKVIMIQFKFSNHRHHE